MKIIVSFLVVIQLLSVVAYAQNVSLTQYPSASTQNLTVVTSDVSVSNATTQTSLNPAFLYASSELPALRGAAALVKRTYITFDINALNIPSNAVISSAKLYLFNPSTTSTAEAALPTNFFTLGYLNQDLVGSTVPSWTESLIWLNQINFPSTSDLVQSSTFLATAGSVLSHREFDVKTYLQRVVSMAIPNFGCVIKVKNEATPTVVTTAGTYYSRESTLAGTKPKLVVSYYIPFSVTNAVITHASTATSADGSIAPVITGGSSAPTYKWYNSAGTLIQTSSSSIVRNLAPGWYGLEIVGTVSGVTMPSVYMAFLVGAYCETSTITFAPGPNYIDDAAVSQARPNLVGGGELSFSTSLDNRVLVNLPVISRLNSVMRFRLWVDNKVTINTANLTLAGFGSGNSVNTAFPTNQSLFSKLKGNWSETAASWNNINPIPTDPATATISNSLVASESKIVNMKSFWDSWKVDNTQNYGVLFKIDPGTGTFPATYTVSRSFSSSDNATVANRPSLSFSIRLTDNCKDKVSYIKLEKALKGVNYRVQNRLLFFYDEEYTNTTHTTINYRIYDESNQSMSALTNNQQKALSHGDNRYVIDISTLTLNKSYILEVTNDKSEKFYLRFTKEN